MNSDIVEAKRPYAGPGKFDELRLRAVAGREFDRTNDIAASLTNHFILDDGDPADTRLSGATGSALTLLGGLPAPQRAAAPLGTAKRLPEEEAMHAHFTVIFAEQRAADIHRSAQRSPRAREAPGRPNRRFGLRPSHAPLPQRAHADLRGER